MIDVTDPHDDRFKRAQRLFVKEWDEAVDLVGFVEAIGVPAARWVFGWGLARVRAYERLKQHVGADGYHAMLAYQSSFGVDTGVAVLRAMQRGGWKRGKLPKVVKDALRQLHHEGLTLPDIARLVGMKRDAVEWAIRVHKPRGVKASAAYAMLA